MVVEAKEVLVRYLFEEKKRKKKRIGERRSTVIPERRPAATA
jgi:hypothetical protein